MAEHGRYGKGSVMVWEGISGILTALKYCNEILNQFVKSYGGSSSQEFILMDNNAMPVPTVHKSLAPIWNMKQSFI